MKAQNHSIIKRGASLLALLSSLMVVSACSPTGITATPSPSTPTAEPGQVDIPSRVPATAAETGTPSWPEKPSIPASLGPSMTPPRLSPNPDTATPKPFGLVTAPTRITPAPIVPGTLALSPPILSFQVVPQKVEPGGAVTVSWKVQAGDVLLALQTYDSMTLLETWRDLPLEGSRSVNIPPEVRIPLDFVLSVSEPSALAYYRIRLVCPDTWGFPGVPGEEDLCPASMVRWRGAAQRFEHGFMLWRPATSINNSPRITIFLDSGTFSSYDDSWQEGMLEGDPSLVSPDGLIQPTRGFGLVWRTNPDVQTRLGWATGAEFGYDGVWQSWHAGYHHYPPGYQQTPWGIVRTLSSGAWAFVTVQ